MSTLLYYLSLLAVLASIYGIYAIGLNIHWGYAGILDFTFISFVAIGGYIGGVLTAGPPGAYSGETYILGMHLPFVVAVLLGGLAAAAFAALIGLVALNRLRSDYFAIVTVAVGEILWTTIGDQYGVFNGWDGISGVPQPLSSIVPFADYNFVFLAIAVVFLIVVYLFAERLRKSPWGRVVRGIREDEVVSQHLGKPTYRRKFQALLIGAFLGGIGGALQVSFIGAINPSAWTAGETFFLWAAVLIGGSGNNRGAVLGAVIVPVVFAEITRYLPQLGANASLLAAFRQITVGLLLIAVLYFRPQGLLPEPRHLLARRSARPTEEVSTDA